LTYKEMRILQAIAVLTNVPTLLRVLATRGATAVLWWEASSSTIKVHTIKVTQQVWLQHEDVAIARRGIQDYCAAFVKKGTHVISLVHASHVRHHQH